MAAPRRRRAKGRASALSEAALHRIFGAYYGHERSSRGITQEEVAHRLGWEVIEVVRFEEGRRLIEIDEFFDLHRAIGLDPRPTMAWLRELARA